MRILYVHERFGALGGAEANALITARELRGRGHEIGLLHGYPTGKSHQAWEAVFEPRFPIHTGAGGEGVRQVIREFQPDLVYVHKMADLEVIEALVASNLPLVRMVHDHDIYCMRSYKYSYLTRRICERAASGFCVYGCGAFIARDHGSWLPVKYVSYREKKREIALNHQFDRVISVSEFMKGELLKNGFPNSKLEILPPVPQPGDPALRSSFSDRNLIVYAGQIIRGKGVDILLEALALLELPFECIILGDGGHKEYCQELARNLGLEGRVTFKGFVPQEELKNYYRECTVVAVSSVWPEPIATIGMEVMRYGLPVVAFDAGGISDWLQNGENGFLVPWMDREAFAEKLQVLLSNKALARQMGEKGLQIASEKYDFAKYIEQLEKVFEDVVAKKRGCRSPRFEPAVDGELSAV